MSDRRDHSSPGTTTVRGRCRTESEPSGHLEQVLARLSENDCSSVSAFRAEMAHGSR